MMRVLLLIMSLVTVALAGCGGPTDRCSTPSRCKADPPPTTGDIKACEQLAQMPPRCWAEKSAFDDCFRSKAVCGSDDKTDAVQTFAACKALYEAYAKCMI